MKPYSQIHFESITLYKNLVAIEFRLKQQLDYKGWEIFSNIEKAISVDPHNSTIKYSLRLKSYLI